jgi:release factor glutamine methyltransferase
MHPVRTGLHPRDTLWKATLQVRGCGAHRSTAGQHTGHIRDAVCITLAKRYVKYSIHFGMATVTESLESGTALLAPSATARRDAELLMMHVTGSSRAELMTHPERELTQRQQEHYQAAIVRRARHEPVQHILGTQYFYGRSFIVNRLVLIPRPETEHLVEAVLAIRPAPRYVLDIGTGSGILAITLALELPDAALTATDISPAALAVAQQNARVLNAERVRFVQSDLFEGLREERFDCIVSNPPYVATDEVLEPQVREYEPATALYAGEDGLAIYRRLIPEAFEHLEAGGYLWLEIGHGQRDALRELLAQGGLVEIGFVDDLLGIPRVAKARKPLE